ncbi:unnamed protein product, partial [Phaeothamnion confervicola]
MSARSMDGGKLGFLERARVNAMRQQHDAERRIQERRKHELKECTFIPVISPQASRLPPRGVLQLSTGDAARRDERHSLGDRRGGIKSRPGDRSPGARSLPCDSPYGGNGFGDGGGRVGGCEWGTMSAPGSPIGFGCEDGGAGGGAGGRHRGAGSGGLSWSEWLTLRDGRSRDKCGPEHTFRPALATADSDLSPQGISSKLRVSSEPWSYMDRVMMETRHKEAAVRQRHHERAMHELQDCTFQPRTKNCPEFVRRAAAGMRVAR